MTTRLQADLTAAQARERIAVECYERQQQAQRELEALYTAMTERALEAEERERALSAALTGLVWGCANGAYHPWPSFEDARRVLGDADPLRYVPNYGPVDKE